MHAALKELSQGLSRSDFLAQSANSTRQVVETRSLKLFDKVAKKSSSEFKKNTCNTVRVDTKSYDRVPYHLTRPFKGQITIPAGARVFLSSNPDKRASITVDNFIVMGYSSSSGSGEFVIGQHEPVYLNNRRIAKLGSNGFHHNLELTKNFPQGVTVSLWAYALDYGGVGSLSDVYLIVQ
jgi:bifunctional DNA-binding transcriptional regulator/antitoxin component of YhaV-PrlF toxin-antitoxin module